MPRKSATAIELTAIEGRANRLRPPSTLSEPERKIFLDLVGACRVDHFQACDLPLLVAYCQACAQSDLAVQHLRDEGYVIDGKASPWVVIQEKATRSMTAFSMRLRVSPQ